jgi:hypothetical protein
MPLLVCLLVPFGKLPRGIVRAHVPWFPNLHQVACRCFQHILKLTLPETKATYVCTYRDYYCDCSDQLAVYRVFQNELYNFESLYKFIQRACTVF